ncbi:hypothetical protein F4782DRAFT_507391 [Xylaria castorea]|nr:hypothetical protein F4782DRAFT_507391 [Xylaria castorea]
MFSSLSDTLFSGPFHSPLNPHHIEPSLTIGPLHYRTAPYCVKAAEEVNGASGSSDRVASVPDTPCMNTGYVSDTSETLTNGDNSEDDSDSAGYTINNADGVVDTRTTTRNDWYYDDFTAGVDVDNSLRINKAGKFHLGSQWQVPGANIAQSKAGSEFGEASIWSEWSEPRLNNAAPPSKPELDTMLLDEVVTDRMQTLDLANLHRPHEPFTGPGDDPSRDYGSCAQHQATSAPLTAALNCHSYSYSETEDGDDYVVTNKGPSGGPGGEGSYTATPAAAESYYDDFETYDDDYFVLREAPNTVDISMRGAR